MAESGASAEQNSLWLYSLSRDGLVRVAPELSDVRDVSPSPDGRHVAALTTVGETQQIVVIDLEDGGQRFLTQLAQGVSGAPRWSPDGCSIAFTAIAFPRDPDLPYRVRRETYRQDGLGIIDDAAYDIFVADVPSGHIRQLTNDECMNVDPQWSPDGSRLIYRVTFQPDRISLALPELHLLDLVTLASRVLVPDAWGGVQRAEWCDDGETLVFFGWQKPLSSESWGAQELGLWTVADGRSTPQLRTENAYADAGVSFGSLQSDLPICRELTARSICLQRDRAYVSLQQRGEIRIGRVALTGPQQIELVEQASAGSHYLLDVHPDGGVLQLVASFTEPPRLCLGDRTLFDPNVELLAPLARPRVHHLRATASDGVSTDAWAVTPRDGTNWPTILYVHGGPFGSAFGDSYLIDVHLLVAAGFAVIMNNFRGSSGYGKEFAEMLVGAWGSGAALDHHAALDEAILRGIADPDRIGVYGLSYGGFASCWLVGTSTRFKAAVAENPFTSWSSFYGLVDNHFWIPQEFGGATPDEAVEAYWEASPLAHADACVAPLLFIVSESDLRCPPAESEQYYRRLKANGIVAEMLRLPKADHVGSWCGSVPVRNAQNEALVNWFTEHLA